MRRNRQIALRPINKAPQHHANTTVAVDDITHAFDVMSEATNNIQSRPKVVTISVTPTFAAKILIPRLGELNALLPDIELRTVATKSVSDFDRDQIDIAVRLTNTPFPLNLEAVRLFQQELIAVDHFIKIKFDLKITPRSNSVR